jgi:hypothetical protein
MNPNFPDGLLEIWNLVWRAAAKRVEERPAEGAWTAPTKRVQERLTEGVREHKGRLPL